jgi:hypothetical protein
MMQNTTGSPSKSQAVRWSRVGDQEYQVEHGDKVYRLCKSHIGWYLHAKREGVEFENFGGLTELVKPGEGPGFFTEGFGRNLKQAKANVRMWLQRGVTFNDAEWII